jgi:hypothetical protein
MLSPSASSPAVPPANDSAAAEAAPQKDGPSSAAPGEAAGPSAPKLAAEKQLNEKPAEAAVGDQELTELEREAQTAERLEGVARLASQAQPKGHTLDSAGVHIKASHIHPENCYMMMIKFFYYMFPRPKDSVRRVTPG